MYRDSRWWYHYWRRKGHVSKKWESTFRKIDISVLYGNKAVVDSSYDLNIATGCNVILFSDHILVKFYKDAVLDMEYNISVTSTPCNYGGQRHWFLCPNPICKRRSKILYLYHNLFVCRKCLKLGYFSQIQSPFMRYLFTKDKIIKKLSDKGGGEFTRPRYMHNKTFKKLQEKIWSYDDKAEGYLMKNCPF